MIPAVKQFLTLESAIELGEYHPDVLSQFSEFKELPRYTQFQLIRKALKNRERQLRLHWAEVNNQLNFSKKPHLKEALQGIEQQINRLNDDEEKLLVEYSR